MEIKKTKKIEESRWLQLEVQTIAGEIARHPISRRNYRLLSKKLDNALGTLQVMETQSKTHQFFANRTSDLKEQVVQLYKDLEDGLVQRQISQIKEESTLLKQGQLTQDKIKKLKMNISKIEKNYLPSIEDRKVIAEAKSAVLEATAKNKPITHHFDFISSQKNVHFVEKPELLPGEMEEILDIARAVYNGALRHARMLYNSLPQEHQSRFEKHMQHLMAKPFVDVLETTQALMAVVNELVGNGQGYLNQVEIDQFFLGICQCEPEENRREGKIFSLRPEGMHH